MLQLPVAIDVLIWMDRFLIDFEPWHWNIRRAQQMMQMIQLRWAPLSHFQSRNNFDHSYSEFSPCWDCWGNFHCSNNTQTSNIFESSSPSSLLRALANRNLSNLKCYHFSTNLRRRTTELVTHLRSHSFATHKASFLVEVDRMKIQSELSCW